MFIWRSFLAGERGIDFQEIQPLINNGVGNLMTNIYGLFLRKYKLVMIQLIFQDARKLKTYNSLKVYQNQKLKLVRVYTLYIFTSLMQSVTHSDNYHVEAAILKIIIEKRLTRQ